MICSCEKHLDEAIDDFVDQYQEPPEIIFCNDTADTRNIPLTVCNYCNEKAIYALVRVAETLR
jgi:CxxH/CxxC protein (TIGR04129 family)